jgi:hypothetical protein
MAGKDQQVTPHSDGGWQVMGSGNQKPTKVTDTKKSAVDIARAISKNQRSELFIHGKDGQIQAKDSHGHDPFPPKG